MIKRLLITGTLFYAFAAVAQTTLPILQPHATFVNGSGSPCSMCQLFSYAAGTTTPQATYTDASGGTPNSNPVLLDSAGGASIWMGMNAYKFVLKDPIGSIIWTVDNVPGSTGGVSYLPLTGGTLTGAITGTTATFSGSITAANIRTTVSPVIDPTAPAFGAKCDGSTDDSAAFTAASLAANGYYTATGVQAIVLIPYGASGKCNITNAIIYYSGTHFKGSGGTIVNNANTAYSFSNSNTNDGNDAVWFDGVRIKQTTSGSLPAIAYVGGNATGGGTHSGFWITDSDIQGSGYAIKMNVFLQSDNTRHTIDDIKITGNHVWCALISGAYDTACRDGINLNGDATNITIANNRIEQRADAAIAFTSAGGSSASNFPGFLQFLTPTYVTVTGNVMTNVGAGLDFSGGNTITASGNTCTDTLTNSVGDPCIRFIHDFYPLPSNIQVIGGKYSNYPVVADPANVKMDFTGTAVSGSYPVCNCSITGAEIGGLIYLTGNGFSLNSNRLDSGTTLSVQVENGDATNAITLQGNTWLGSQTISLTSINGGITGSYMVGDFLNGKVTSMTLTPAQSGAGAVSSQPASLCGQSYNGSSVVYNPGCFNDQVAFGAGSNPSLIRTHSAAPGNSSWSGVEQWNSGAIFNTNLVGVWPSIATGSSFGAGGLFIANNASNTAAEVDLMNVYQTNSTGGLDQFSFYGNRISASPMYLGGIRGDGSYNSVAGYRIAGTLGFSGTKVAGSCTFTIVGGIITGVAGC